MSAGAAHSEKETAATILVIHTSHMRRHCYGEEALQGLQSLASVRYHEGGAPLEGAALIAAIEDVCVIVSDRVTAGAGRAIRRPAGA